METKFIQNITPALVPSALVQAFIPVPGSPGNYQVVYVPKGIFSKDGSWTPSISATNDAVVSVATAYYQYSGGAICQFSMAFQVELGAGEIGTIITISDLPVSSTFTTSRQVIIALNPGNPAQLNAMDASTVGTEIEFALAVPVAGSTINLSVVGHYLVL
jgi:hypothetical protein